MSGREEVRERGRKCGEREGRNCGGKGKKKRRKRVEERGRGGNTERKMNSNEDVKMITERIELTRKRKKLMMGMKEKIGTRMKYFFLSYNKGKVKSNLWTDW